MRTGVILSTYGEPTRNTFADQWMYSYRILEGLTRKIAKIPKPVLPIIATALRGRPGEALERAEVPFAAGALHEQTVAALTSELKRRGQADRLVVTRAYQFRRPGLADGAVGSAPCRMPACLRGPHVRRGWRLHRRHDEDRRRTGAQELQGLGSQRCLLLLPFRE